MGSLDNDIDLAKARNWGREVEMELSAVKTVLTKVSEECQTIPAETDPILKEIGEVGDQLSETWYTLGGLFNKATESLEKICNEWEKTISQGIEAIKEFKSRIGL